MGGFGSKSNKYNTYEKDLSGLKEKIMVIQGEMNEISYQREKENREYENEIMVFSFKEAEWKQKRKKLREEVKILRRVVEEKDERIREMEEKGSELKELGLLGSDGRLLMEQMREKKRRDETVEKWKQLYLAIKIELDDLIQRTHKDGMYWRGGEKDTAEKLKKELETKDETINALNLKLASMEHELNKRDREVDILRQSLKIVSSKKVLQTNEKPRNSFIV